MFADIVRSGVLVSAAFLVLLPVAAFADSCWDHNGSQIRLTDAGTQRAFYYEYPKPNLRGAGVVPGTLLFNGSNIDGWYSGTARVFSKFCPGEPLEYHVEGPVSRQQTRVTLRGTREVMERCRPTGAIINDTLVFNYTHQC
ncbi:MAG: hypothetical protein ACOH2J_20885 [Allorhizobium sp.]